MDKRPTCGTCERPVFDKFRDELSLQRCSRDLDDFQREICELRGLQLANRREGQVVVSTAKLEMMAGVADDCQTNPRRVMDLVNHVYELLKAPRVTEVSIGAINAWVMGALDRVKIQYQLLPREGQMPVLALIDVPAKYDTLFDAFVLALERLSTGHPLPELAPLATTPARRTGKKR